MALTGSAKMKLPAGTKTLRFFCTSYIGCVYGVGKFCLLLSYWGTACFGVPPAPASRSHTTSPAATAPSPSGQGCSCRGTARGERVLVKWTNGVFYFSLLVFALFEMKVLVIVLPVPQSRPLTATSHPKGKGLREGKRKGLTGKISWSPQCAAIGSPTGRGASWLLPRTGRPRQPPGPVFLRCCLNSALTLCGKNIS
uniref:Uncharacterized protein n=1 Tax=Accipiter nisus TaxID=211598 RepID=A0A8B9NH54_9AVES